MGLYYKEYESNCYLRNEILTFAQACNLYETICDNDLICLIKKYELQLLIIRKSVTDHKTNEHRVYCEKVNQDSFKEEYEVKGCALLRSEVERLAIEEPNLKDKLTPIFFDDKSNKLEIEALREEKNQLILLLKTKESEVEELRNRLSTKQAQEGLSETTAERWAAHLEIAIKVANYCFMEKEKYTDDDLQKIGEREFGHKLAVAALAALKRGLPEEYRYARGERKSAGSSSNPTK